MLTTKEQIGKLDRKILIQRAIYGAAGTSNERLITGWTEIAENGQPWANVEDGPGSEEFEGDQLVAVQTVNITMRYWDDISMQYRILFDGNIHNIISSVKIGRKRFLKLITRVGGQYEESNVGGLGSFSPNEYSDAYDR
jgi:SPP1 family predicted phage head-tail adaptor